MGQQFLQFMNLARVYGDRDPAELEKLGLPVLYALSAPNALITSPPWPRSFGKVL